MTLYPVLGAINSAAIASANEALSTRKPGEAVDLEVLREGRVLTLRPTLKEER